MAGGVHGEVEGAVTLRCEVARPRSTMGEREETSSRLVESRTQWNTE